MIYFIISIIILLIIFIFNYFKLKKQFYFYKKVEDNLKNKKNKIQSELLKYKETYTLYKGNNELILFVDDEKNILNLFETLFHKCNYNLVGFDDTKKALSFLEKNKNEVKLIISDLSLPNIFGLELIKQLKSINTNIPLIIFTGYSYVEFDSEEERKLVDMIIYKPTKIEEIINTVYSILNKGKIHEKN